MIFLITPVVAEVKQVKCNVSGTFFTSALTMPLLRDEAAEVGQSCCHMHGAGLISVVAACRYEARLLPCARSSSQICCGSSNEASCCHVLGAHLISAVAAVMRQGSMHLERNMLYKVQPKLQNCKNH